ncbi:hypothetical protein PG994_015328 [Apiospora phragmitis]|uniref:HD domain-containing protein n=1 Tax=Apiospora phragmitis TaxID=2905665 RepID=A0ABR1SSK4_9PEZI
MLGEMTMRIRWRSVSERTKVEKEAAPGRRCIFIGLVHDLGESIVGDIPTYADVPKEKKKLLETSAFQYLEALLGRHDQKYAEEIVEAWDDYENGNTPEGRWVKEVDKLECIMQAQEYEQVYRSGDFDEFQGLSTKIISVEGQRLLELLRKERQAQRLKEAQRYPIVFLLWENIEVAAHAVVDLLKKKLDEIKDGQWVVVRGFPENTEQLLWFERLVQKPNHILLLNGEGQASSPRQPRPVAGNVDFWEARDMKLEDYLRQHCGLFETIVGGFNDSKASADEGNKPANQQQPESHC